MPLILASKSPRRRELMQLITRDFTVCAADVDEGALAAPSPAELAERLAKTKAKVVWGAAGPLPVIGCDTVVELDGAVLGKPADRQQAIGMLTALSGRAHQVHTGVCVLFGEKNLHFTETTTVHFAPLPPAEILAVASTPEPYDKAGAYGIQGWAARFVPRIEGCYYNVMGLPVAALWQVLAENGLL